MFFESNLFWFLMGMLSILVFVGFNYFAEDRGWKMNWWKWILAIIWWGIFSVSFYAWGTMVGEDEAGAGLWLLAVGMFVCVVYGVILWRILAHNSGGDEDVEITETAAVEA